MKGRHHVVESAEFYSILTSCCIQAFIDTKFGKGILRHLIPVHTLLLLLLLLGRRRVFCSICVYVLCGSRASSTHCTSKVQMFEAEINKRVV